ncbi:MAG: phosphohydrolase [Candidatus Lloydbacteria bacterium CG22_combo_CG10-13_8_21_14_all_47_15]|uniref:5'-deoxynucleotidase n=1 Tax=Candidatus Lloydbacteria bacterium CG22_combo_CG10-13_8_21_14_all_47_15 TaxID=1974635 RepID=A0A2H0CV44_9BACT|nr:MAG: phosphohydrolase [Candidatus Lloydbacteria bacterium CG22_combo_CG10-13_8_21_14_all_47_15]
MGSISLAHLLRFSGLMNDFRRVTRVVHANGEDRWENDVEHSYQLAMLAWYLCEAGDLPLDSDIVLKYALVHDLVEVYAGDTYIYSDPEELQSKPERERIAAARLKEELPEFGELHRLIEEYEERHNEESRFVYALDKLHPVLNIYLNDGRTWKEKNITFDMMLAQKRDKIAMSPEVAVYFDAILEILEKEGERVFPI